MAEPDFVDVMEAVGDGLPRRVWVGVPVPLWEVVWLALQVRVREQLRVKVAVCREVAVPVRVGVPVGLLEVEAVRENEGLGDL